MSSRGKTLILILTAAAVYCLSVSGAFKSAATAAALRANNIRSEAVIPAVRLELTEKVSETAEPKPTAYMSGEESVNVTARPVMENIRSETITGGLSIKNETAYQINVNDVLSAGTDTVLPSSGVQILIIHTHSSEAYTPAGLDRYEASDSCRTEDISCNIIRIGDELADIFTEKGLSVIHDRGIYDYPSYTGSYTRSGAIVEDYLSQYPELAVVIDVHRDALGTGDIVYKTMAEEQGVCASQVMMLAGTDESGLDHPRWRSNLSLVLYLQNAVNSAHPTLMRPVTLVPQRYNQHLSPGMFILEVGCSGNTLQEALAGVRLYGEAAADALLALVGSE